MISILIIFKLILVHQIALLTAILAGHRKPHGSAAADHNYVSLYQW